MTIPGPLELASDAELLEELCRRSRSGAQRAFIGMYMRPVEGRSASDPRTGWLICAGEDPEEMRQAIILLLQQLGIGLPLDYRWLWENLVPNYTLQPRLGIQPKMRPVMDAALLNMRGYPIIKDDPGVLGVVDQLMERHALVRHPHQQGWSYLNNVGRSVFNLVPTPGLLFTGE